ncbi:hypothetical protein [Rippkaea orientalis]|uniref:hypothetical protein n=1 Tax=Rippkaea orientalis TaxID=2546366 RepID=UPI0012FE94E9|nr:hypothetical protein [Rippkaea orientalis]
MSSEVCDKLQKAQVKQNQSDYFESAFAFSIRAWCKLLEDNLNINVTPDLTNEILFTLRQKNVRESTNSINSEWKRIIEKKEQGFLKTEIKRYYSHFYSLINKIFTLLNIQGDKDMNFIVLFAFIFVAVLFLAYILNKPKETSQTNDRKKSTTVASESLSIPNITEPVLSPPAQPIPQTLILVIPALKSQFLNELRNRKIVTNEDWENLYDATRYLCLVSPDKVKSQLSKIEPFRVFEGKEEDSDIYFVHIKVSQKDKDLEPNVNGNERVNAFRRLINSPLIMISPRFRLEAYETLNVYNI